MQLDIIETFDKKSTQFIENNYNQGLNFVDHRQKIEDLMLFAFKLGKQQEHKYILPPTP